MRIISIYTIYSTDQQSVYRQTLMVSRDSISLYGSFSMSFRRCCAILPSCSCSVPLGSAGMEELTAQMCPGYHGNSLAFSRQAEQIWCMHACVCVWVCVCVCACVSQAASDKDLHRFWPKQSSRHLQNNKTSINSTDALTESLWVNNRAASM